MEILMEDDAFFADLNRQISLLIMDDDDQDSILRTTPSVSLQSFPHQTIQHPIHPSFFHPEELVRREIKGTGVFIPRSSQPRRKNRQSGKNSSKSVNRHNNSTSRVTNYNTNTFNSPTDTRC